MGPYLRYASFIDLNVVPVSAPQNREVPKSRNRMFWLSLLRLRVSGLVGIRELGRTFFWLL